ncbi:MAG: 50S ribosomal protein L11 methyltransferase [Ramlibacter sp.]|nr:50S ribosomal protein L11 methyltransferase [Ramlibacter sp.]
MNQTIDALKKQFKDGNREEAIAACEALCAQSPSDLALKKLWSTMHDAEVVETPGSSHFNAGIAFVENGKPSQAMDSFKSAIKLAPHDGDMLKKATLALLDSGRGNEALALCNTVLKTQPDNLVAKQGAEWILSRLVPLWHVPMMNEYERNKAFHDGLAALVTPDKVVFEIGAGSGLLAMMAAKLGAKKVVTCEAVSLIAETARKIVERNGPQGQVTVLSKPSSEVRIGTDLPAKADILVHEIFSSELLGEHVLPAIEDAKARLLKPGGAVLPMAASVMIALVGGDVLGKNLYVDESFGFDLRAFNTINPRKRPIYREDLAPVLMSDAVEAFRFDFVKSSTFPAAKRQIDITSRKAGLCYGVIQWIRVDMVKGVQFENHPAHPRDVSNWQHTIYSFMEPLALEVGTVVSVSATHDRQRPWFELASPDSSLRA